MNSLGIVLPHLGSGQITYEGISLANKASDAVIFFEQLTPACMPIHCGTMSLTEIMNFGGLLVTTSIDNTILASKLANRKAVKLVFYVWDLEWLRPGKQDFLYNYGAYQLPDILVVRNEEHVAPLFNYCNRQPLVKEFEQVIAC